jgi:hypothetical protein
MVSRSSPGMHIFTLGIVQYHHWWFMMLLLSRFGQLQAVDVEGVEPALRPNTDLGNNLRSDTTTDFEHRCATTIAFRAP